MEAATEIRAEFVAMLREDIGDIERQLDTLSRALVGHNTVIETSEGMYLVNNGGKYGVTSITRCSRWFPEDASKLCANDNIKNGAGLVAKPVKLRTALRTELQRANELLDTVKLL